MSRKDKFFEDFLAVSGSAFTSLLTAQKEVAELFREKFEAYVGKLNVVSREEYEHLLDMCSKIREENEALQARLALLEQQVQQKSNK